MISSELVDPDDIDYEEYSSLQRSAFAEILENAKVANEYLNENYFKWKYHTPAGKAVVAIVKDGDKILASNAMFPLFIKYKNSVFRGWQSCDTATLPSMRGKGYFKNCIQLLSNYVEPNELFFGFPNNNSIHGFKKIGWVSKGIITTWVNPVSLFACDLSRNINQLFCFDELHNSFLKNTGEDDYISIIKDSKYLNWRYVQNPVYQYNIFVFHDRGEAQGYIIVRTADVLDHKIVIVMELCTLTPKIGIILLRHIAQWAKRLSRKIVVLLDNTLSLKIAFQTGFLPVWSKLLQKKQVLMYDPIFEVQMKEIRMGKWHVQMGDWDGF